MNFPFKHASRARCRESSAPAAADRPDEQARDGFGGGAHARQMLAGLEAALLADDRPSSSSPTPDWTDAGPAWQPRQEQRVRVAPPDASRSGAPAPNPHLRPADETAVLAPRQAGGWGGEERHSVDRLAVLLRERQMEREQRYARTAFDEHGDEEREPAYENAEEPEDIGERFGWEERYTGEDVRQYLEMPAGHSRRRRVIPALAFAGALVGVSAAAALFIVAPGDAPAPESAPEAVQADVLADTAPTSADAEVATGLTAQDGENVVRPSSTQSMPAATTEFPATQAGTLRSLDSPVSSAAADESVRRVDPAAGAATASDGAAVRQVGPPSFVRPTATAEDPAGASAAAEVATGEEPAIAAPVEAEAPVTAEAATPVEEAATTQAQTTSDVNMRTGPENDASVVTVIPVNSSVDLIGCDFWCEVIYDGQQGYVYRDFIAGAD